MLDYAKYGMQATATTLSLRDRGDTTVGVIGMGYVGIPTAVFFANHSRDVGFVWGIQRASENGKKKIDKLNASINPLSIQDPELDMEIRSAVGEYRFKCTPDATVLSLCDTIIVCVQTPFSENFGFRNPDYSALESALQSIVDFANWDEPPTVIIESTVSPGTTSALCANTLNKNRKRKKAGVDFALAHVPERVTAGKTIRNLHTLDRCVGGINDYSTATALRFYDSLNRTGSNIPMTAIEAEITKTAENAIRDLQIATANQLALYCETLGADFYRVKQGIDSLQGEGITRGLLMPGPGVGGGCLPKDGYHLEYALERVINPLPSSIPSLFRVSRDINDFMPNHTFNLLLDGLAAAGKLDSNYGENLTIAVLGYTAIRNADDTRNTPTIPFLKHIEEELRYARVRVHDPFRSVFASPIEKVLKGADAIVLMMDHDDYYMLETEDIRRMMGVENPVLVDGKNVFDERKCTKHGFIYRCIGKGR